MHCDKHVIKMCCEYAQILSTAHRLIDGKMWYGMTPAGRKKTVWYLDDGLMNYKLYKASHYNHPSNVWVRKSIEHYDYVYDLWFYLCELFHETRGKHHKSWTQLGGILKTNPMGIAHDAGFEPPPAAIKQMDVCVVPDDTVATYRNFYWVDKKDFATWQNREEPYWWKEFKQSAGELIGPKTTIF